MLNFTAGPVQMDFETRKKGFNQIPYFRTPEFSKTMKENEKMMLELFSAPEESKAVFLTASGTGAMEAAVSNLFSSDDKVLVVNGGTFGKRLCEICSVHEIPFVELKLDYGENLSFEKLNRFKSSGLTAILLQLCETSTGVLYDMKAVSRFALENNLFIFTDAVSGFLADDFSMKDLHVNASVTSSQKNLALPPGLSFVILDKTAQERVFKSCTKNIYFDLKNYLKNMERGQTPFTPCVGILLQLNKRLKNIIKKGGAPYCVKETWKKAEFFRSRIKNLALKIFTSPESSSNFMTALSPVNENVSAYHIFELLKDEYKIWICPNGGDLKDKVFRVGHGGSLSKRDFDKLIKALKKLNKRGEL